MGAAVGAVTTAANATNPVGWGMIAAQAIPEIYKLFTAGKQKRMANQYAKTQRPAYEIPQALKDYLAQTKFNAAVSGLPGQGQLEKKLGRQTASTLNMGRGMSATNAIANAAAADYNTKKSLEDTAYDAARYKAARQQDLYNAETAMAKQQLAQWQWDKQSPYTDAMAATSALNQSANENAMLGLEGLMSAFQTAGKAGLFGAGNRAAGGKTGSGIADAAGTAAASAAGGIAGRVPAPDVPAATAPNWAAGPLLGTDFNTLNSGYSFQDPNSPNYKYSMAENGMGYDVYNSNTGKTVYAPMNQRAGGSIADYDPFISSIMQPRVPGSDMSFPDMQLSPIGDKPELTGPMEQEYGPGARRAMKRGGEVSQFNMNVPDEIRNNWTNNYFGMEMPTAYGYGQTWNDIMNRIATQYGLGDMYGEETARGVDRLYSRFNPFG